MSFGGHAGEKERERYGPQWSYMLKSMSSLSSLISVLSSIQPTAKSNIILVSLIKVYLVFILYLHKHDSEKCPRNFTYQIHSCTLASLQIQGNFEQCLTFFQKLSPTEGADS